MSLAANLLGEFDHEMAGTRRVLERVPLERFDWTPHARSFSLGKLANHLVNLLRWGAVTMTAVEFDLAGEGFPRQVSRTREELLAAFDAQLTETRAAIADAKDDAMLAPWTLRQGDKILFTLPRFGVLRNMVFNHNVHHRGQMTVYLRLLDIPIPGLYGPSADEA